MVDSSFGRGRPIEHTGPAASAKLRRPVVENLIQDLAEGLGQWAYLLVAFMALAETAAFIGFIAPGEFAIIFGGVLAGEGTLSIELLIGIVWASAVAGDAIGFQLGRRFGRGFAVKHGPKVRLTEERLRSVEQYFARHGGKTIIVGRWLGLVRPLMPFTAGTSGMPYRRFLPYDVLSAGAWSTVFCLLGFIFYRSFTRIADIAGKGALAFGIVVVLFVGGYQVIKHLRRPEDRRHFAAWAEQQGQKPVLRPLAAVLRALWIALLRPLWRFVLHPAWRVIAPPVRFLIARLTPGELGIELTTVLSIAAVCVYMVILQINLIQSGDPLISGDRSALDLARDIESGTLTTLAKALSFLGSFWVVLIAVGVAGAFMVTRRRIAEAVALAIGFAGTTVAFHVLKAAVDRARPHDALVDASGSAYPSGHAALAVTYLAIAVLLARAGPAPRRLAIVLTGLGLAVAIGLSRAYLRVHWLSDVGGGWAVGLAVYSACGGIALVVHYLRHNLGDTRAADAPR
jgi:membrane protein DedA with SNARE-associated domain/membrane-associated phospholipid phosphatase